MFVGCNQNSTNEPLRHYIMFAAILVQLNSCSTNQNMQDFSSSTINCLPWWPTGGIRASCSCRITQHPLQIWKQPLALESFHLHNCICEGESSSAFVQNVQLLLTHSPLIASLKGYKYFTVICLISVQGEQQHGSLLLLPSAAHVKWQQLYWSVQSPWSMQRLGAPLPTPLQIEDGW